MADIGTTPAFRLVLLLLLVVVLVADVVDVVVVVIREDEANVDESPKHS